jgi:hypothetical protein
MWRDRVAAKYGVQSDAVDEIELVNDPDWLAMLHCLDCLAKAQGRLARRHGIDHDRIAEMASKQLRAGHPMPKE